ncbi:MAG: septum formation inhibitor Maf [Acidobacteria bacterium]|nr:septum formation inhibitor Maf [Acidobacteriota bacterium]
MRLVLASASPRRRELLLAAGIDCDVIPANVDERTRAGEAPEDYALRLAGEKAGAVKAQAGTRPVLGADTIVIINSEILGKPVDDADALRMLTLLSGQSHDVVTAIALWWPGQSAPSVAVERTRVWMRTIFPEEIAAAVASGEPDDKAGAYAIQGLASRWIVRIDGAYATVVGLPVEAVDRLIRAGPKG